MRTTQYLAKDERPGYIVTAATRRPGRCPACGKNKPCPEHTRRRKTRPKLIVNQVPTSITPDDSGAIQENVTGPVAFSGDKADTYL
jgi:hypothetical protein